MLQRSRHGLGVIEVIVSVVLLSVVLGLAASMSTEVLRYRASIARRRASTEAANNLLEIAMSLPYDRIDVPTLEALAPELNGDLGSPQWTIDVTESPSAQPDNGDLAGKLLPSKKVSVLVTSEAALKQAQLHQSPLVAWCYPFADAVGERSEPQAQAQETQP